MDNATKTAKPNYHAQLAERAEQVYGQCAAEKTTEGRQTVILNALKATALESWKNGLDAGRRRAGKPASPAKAA